MFDEIVNYYTKSEGNVYATLLDASKAFDHVQYEQLFRLIIDRNVCASVARLLAFMYTNQSCRIKWSLSISSTFSVNNGVKQGGVLSPLLFNIYIDVLLKRLEENHVGCHVGKKFVGCIAYADDIVLLSPSVSSLSFMLRVCEKFSKEVQYII